MSRLKSLKIVLILLTCLTACDASSYSKNNILERAIGSIENSHSYTIPVTGTIEVAFSPNEGAEHLVLKVIDSAKKNINVMAYSFTSAPVVSALLKAKKRGVSISIVADKKGNKSEKSRAALSALINAGCDVRTISAYPIAHDKVVIVDEQTVETGSFNYSAAAAHKNSENVIVNWNNPQLAKIYMKHFDRNYKKSDKFEMNY